jgi:hypothetical protein
MMTDAVLRALGMAFAMGWEIQSGGLQSASRT